MEALIVILGFAVLAVAAELWGVDSARTDDREPRRAL